jgi:hypothetical protein
MIKLTYIYNNNNAEATVMLKIKRASFNHLVSTLRSKGCLKIPSTPASKRNWQCSFMFLDLTIDFESFTTHGGGRLRQYLVTFGKSCMLLESSEER